MNTTDHIDDDDYYNCRKSKYIEMRKITHFDHCPFACVQIAIVFRALLKNRANFGQ